MQAIYFDMDGTVYDLYGVDNWLEGLRAEDTTPYKCGNACVDLDALNEIMCAAVALGIVVGVITWSAMNGSKEYNKAVRKVKREWVQENMPYVTEFHCVKYGTPKHTTAKYRDSVLVDDNADVRAKWSNGSTIDATKDILEILKNFVAQLENM